MILNLMKIEYESCTIENSISEIPPVLEMEKNTVKQQTNEWFYS